MSFITWWGWLANLVGRHSGRRQKRHPSAPRRYSRWLFVEALEDRTVPSTFQWIGGGG